MALALVIATVVSLSVASAQENDRRAEVLRDNEYAARWVAGTVLYKLREYHDAAVEAAGGLGPELIARLRDTDLEIQEGDALERYCKDVHIRYAPAGNGTPPFASWFILDKNGKARARWPAPPGSDFLARDYEWRDYFKGALQRTETGSRRAYVSRAITSEASQTQRFAISAPIYDEKNEWVGVLVAMTDTGATLGTLQLGDIKDDRHIAAIVASRDNNRESKGKPLPTEYIILVHNSLPRGTAKVLGDSTPVRKAVERAKQSNPDHDDDQLKLLGLEAVSSEEGYCDPVLDDCSHVEAHAGRWLAGFAPVGNTGFVVIVQTPRDDAARPNETLARRFVFWGGPPFALGTTLLALAAGIARRRAARKRG